MITYIAYSSIQDPTQKVIQHYVNMHKLTYARGSLRLHVINTAFSLEAEQISPVEADGLKIQIIFRTS